MENTNVEKPQVTLVGEDGNVFNLIAICSRALKRVGQRDKASEMSARCFSAGSYDEALQIMMEYCDIDQLIGVWQ